MSAREPVRRGDDDLTRDLEAALEARRELGPAYEHDLIDNFIEKVDAHIAARAHDEAKRRERARRPPQYPVAIAFVSLGTGIPITAVAGGTAGATGVVVAWMGIAAVNLAAAIGTVWRPRERDR